MRLADHAEKGFILLYAVNREFGVKDLVTAVFAVCLRKHHEFDVGGVTALLGESFNEIRDFIRRERKAHFLVGLFKRRAAARDDVHRCHRLTRNVRKKAGDISVSGKCRFRHPVKAKLGEHLGFAGCNIAFKRIKNAALDALHAVNAAVMHDVGSFTRPGADRSQTRHRQKLKAGLRGCGRITVVKKRI